MEDTLFDPPAPNPKPRVMSAGYPSWVAVWGTQLALVCAPDEGAVRERIKAQARFLIDDEEIRVRRATRADLDLVEQITEPSKRQQERLTDWRYGLLDEQ